MIERRGRVQGVCDKKGVMGVHGGSDKANYVGRNNLVFRHV